MWRALFYIAFALSSLESFAQVMWQFKSEEVITWNYQEGDEFNGDSVNTSYWNYYFGSARSIYSNKEQQYYTAGKNHEVSGGTLKLSAVKNPITARTVDWRSDNDSLIRQKKFYGLNKTTFAYQAGMIESKNTFLQGYYECRFKLPREGGYWPAFWLHGGDPNEEIDIMECKSERSHQVHVDTHCPNRCDLIKRFLKTESFGSWIRTKADLHDQFNVISCEWDTSFVKFFLNGEFIAISNARLLIPKLLTLNLAVPSDDGPFHPGPKKNDTSAIFEVDYVRVWNKKNVTANSGKVDVRTNFLAGDTLESVQTSSTLRKKSKYFYGSKKAGSEEGIKITMFQNNRAFEFTVLGNTEGNALVYKVINLSQTELASGGLNRKHSAIEFKTLPIGEYDLVLEWDNKSLRHRISVR